MALSKELSMAKSLKQLEFEENSSKEISNEISAVIR